MAKYIVVRRFRDLKHKRVYEIGDSYPASGKRTGKKRTEELSTTNNKNSQVYIEEVKE